MVRKQETCGWKPQVCRTASKFKRIIDWPVNAAYFMELLCIHKTHPMDLVLRI
jgi:hypothetical protein